MVHGCHYHLGRCCLECCLWGLPRRQAEAAIEALKNMSSPMARVRRDGHVIEIDSKELVPGDIVPF